MKFHTKERREYIHITSHGKKILRASKIREGMVLVSVMQIPADIYVNDDETH